MHTAQLIDNDTSTSSDNVIPLRRQHPLTERVLSLSEDVIAQYIDEDEDAAAAIEHVPDHHVLCASEEMPELLSIEEFHQDYVDLRTLETECHQHEAIDLEHAVVALQFGDRDGATTAARHPTMLTIYGLLKALHRYHATSHRAGKAAILRDLIRIRAEHRSA